MQNNMTKAIAEPSNEDLSPVVELGPPTRTLIHTVRVLLSKHDWRGYLKALAAHHKVLARAAKTNADYQEKARQGDAEALAFMLRLELATVATLLLSMVVRAEAVTAFVTLDEAVAASLAALGDVAQMDAEAVHAVLLGAGVLVEDPRPVDTSRDTGGGEPPELDSVPQPSPETEPVTPAEDVPLPAEAAPAPAPDADTQPPVPAEG